MKSSLTASAHLRTFSSELLRPFTPDRTADYDPNMFQYQNGQVIDEERGYTLVKRGGGSSGTEFFILKGPEGEWHFTSFLQYPSGIRQDVLTELGVPTDVEPWVRVVNVESDTWAPLVLESMAAYERGLMRGRTSAGPFDGKRKASVVLLRAGPDGAPMVAYSE